VRLILLYIWPPWLESVLQVQSIQTPADSGCDCLTQMGVITPPVGVNVYVIKGIAPDVPLETIFEGVFPFLGAIIVCLGILMAFPEIALFLPKLVKP
jgi:hypothetical protein